MLLALPLQKFVLYNGGELGVSYTIHTSPLVTLKKVSSCAHTSPLVALKKVSSCAHTSPLVALKKVSSCAHTSPLVALKKVIHASMSGDHPTHASMSGDHPTHANIQSSKMQPAIRHFPIILVNVRMLSTLSCMTLCQLKGSVYGCRRLSLFR